MLGATRATQVGKLNDHCRTRVARLVDDQVNVTVGLELRGDQSDAHRNGDLLCLGSRAELCRRRQGDKAGDRVRARLEVNIPRGRIGQCLDRPPLVPARLCVGERERDGERSSRRDDLHVRCRTATTQTSVASSPTRRARRVRSAPRTKDRSNQARRLVRPRVRRRRPHGERTGNRLRISDLE